MDGLPATRATATESMVKLAELVPVFLRIGVYSFNAGASEALLGQIVEKKGWIDHAAFARLMSVAALIPGPFHVNLVIAAGLHLAGMRGAVSAVSAFILPGFLCAIGIVCALNNEQVFLLLKKNPGVISGLLAAVAGLILSAIVRLGSRIRATFWAWLSFPAIVILLVVFHIPFALVLGISGAVSVFWLAVVTRRLQPGKQD